MPIYKTLSVQNSTNIHAVEFYDDLIMFTGVISMFSVHANATTLTQTHSLIKKVLEIFNI